MERELDIRIVSDAFGVFWVSVNADKVMEINMDALRDLIAEYGKEHVAEIITTAIASKILRAVHEFMEEIERGDQHEDR